LPHARTATPRARRRPVDPTWGEDAQKMLRSMGLWGVFAISQVFYFSMTLKKKWNGKAKLPMTDPWYIWYMNANIHRGYIDGIHGTPYIAPWIRHGL